MLSPLFVFFGGILAQSLFKVRTLKLMGLSLGLFAASCLITFALFVYQLIAAQTIGTFTQYSLIAMTFYCFFFSLIFFIKLASRISELSVLQYTLSLNYLFFLLPEGFTELKPYLLSIGITVNALLFLLLFTNSNPKPALKGAIYIWFMLASASIALFAYETTNFTLTNYNYFELFFLGAFALTLIFNMILGLGILVIAIAASKYPEEVAGMLKGLSLFYRDIHTTLLIGAILLLVQGGIYFYNYQTRSINPFALIALCVTSLQILESYRKPLPPPILKSK